MSLLFAPSLVPLTLTIGKAVVDLLQETKEEKTLEGLKDIITKVEKKRQARGQVLTMP